MPEDFGSYLKHERELRGVPLEEIAQSTKIGIRFLRALEENRLEDLPGPVFIKGFIRSYGQAIGSNVDELLAAFDESGNKGQDTETSPPAISPSQEGQPKRDSGFPMRAVLGIVVALFIIAGGVYWFTYAKGEKAGQPRQTQLETPSTIDSSLPEIEDETVSTAPEEASASASQSDAEISNSKPTQMDTAVVEPPTAIPDKGSG